MPWHLILTFMIPGTTTPAKFHVAGSFETREKCMEVAAPVASAVIAATGEGFIFACTMDDPEKYKLFADPKR